MASSPLRSKSNYHAHSVSWTSRPHPLIPHVDESLRLSGLQNMFDRLDDLLLLPHTQQAHRTWVEEVLEKYLRFLDICAAAKCVSTQTKQDVQNLLSILMRRRDSNDCAGYLSSRKKAKNTIQKSLKDLKSTKNSKSVKSNTTIVGVIGLLNEVEAATVGEFESLLSYIARKKVASRVSGFSLVSKLMHRKSIASNKEETNTNAFENFDDTLRSLNSHSHKTDGVIHMENVQLGKMESSIQDIEGLECMFSFLDSLSYVSQTHSILVDNGKMWEAMWNLLALSSTII
ncbi:uncharacterized protein LOC131327483 [Rhododendron vialii]|uniref:uncharacterized protein LOC131327483 n=1 Tax=Rhododendron vialii TaxID=182163 RepID=UPI00265EF41C|nr:uncharacterized protein LOC131327483 [Rhododendron vialii]